MDMVTSDSKSDWNGDQRFHEFFRSDLGNEAGKTKALRNIEAGSRLHSKDE